MINSHNPYCPWMSDRLGTERHPCKSIPGPLAVEGLQGGLVGSAGDAPHVGSKRGVDPRQQGFGFCSWSSISRKRVDVATLRSRHGDACLDFRAKVRSQEEEEEEEENQEEEDSCT